MPLLWLECNIKAGACVFLKKKVSLPSQLLNAVFLLILLVSLSQHHLHLQMPFECAHRRESILPSQRKNYPGDLRNSSVPFGSSGHSVERASGTQGWVKSTTHLVVTLDPITMVVRNHCPNSVTPQDTAVSHGWCFLLYLLLSPAQKVTAHLGPPAHKGPITVLLTVTQTLFYSARVSFETSPTIFACLRYCCCLSCDFPNPASFTCTPCHLFPLEV